MKKNVIFRIAAIVLMCTLVTACFASSTFAKYTASATTNASTATVAKWDLKVNGNQQLAAANPTVTFELFDTILDTADPGNADANVATEKIAPGTYGEYEMTVTNNSEVDAKVKVTTADPVYTNLPSGVTAAQVPVEFDAVVAKIDGATVTPDGNGWISLPMGKTVTLTYGWTWTFSPSADRDTLDTKFGIQAQTAPTTIAVTATVLAEQVD